MTTFKNFCRLSLLPVVALPLMLLSGCNAILMNPSGDVAIQQRDIILISTGLMLLIIIPVIALTLLFAWRYRIANTKADYRPDWDHSTQLELVIWAAPLLIIIALGAVTWISTHTLDPYQPLTRLDSQRGVPPNTRPLVVEVVALDWKWLFIYPDQGIAMVNELAAPVDRPIVFKITSSSVMNSFFIPALAGQIYAMPGMETKLNAVINEPGDFDGFSANYSGAGFSGMRFKFHGMARPDFDKWVANAKAGGGNLTRADYLELEKPSERDPVRRYAAVDASLYEAVLNRCVEANKMCMKDMMAMDASGGMGKPGTYNLASSTPASASSSPLSAGGNLPGRHYVAAICSPGNLANNFSTSPTYPITQ